MMKKLVVACVALCALATFIVLFQYSVAKSEMRARRASDSQVIETSAGPIEYARSGTEGPLVLIVHGAPGGFRSQPLPNSRTISLSRPGYLRTPIATGRSPREQADAYAALLDALEIDEKVFVYAVSAGGPSGYEFAARHPERTRGLVAVVAQSQSIPPEDIVSILENDFGAWLSINLLSLSGPEAVAEALFPNPQDQRVISESEPLQQEAIDFLWSLWPYSLFRTGYENDMGALADIALPLDDIHVPTLIIHGTRDTSVPYEHAVYASKQIANATFITIEGADHLAPFFTRREEKNAAMRTFMEAN